MGTVSIHQLSVYGYHGCLPEEAVIGTNYSLDIDVELDISKAVAEDDLSATADYVVITRLVHEEMAIRSKLIEHVCGRILKRIRSAFPQAGRIRVTLFKHSPPANGNVQKVSVTLSDG